MSLARPVCLVVVAAVLSGATGFSGISPLLSAEPPATDAATDEALKAARVLLLKGRYAEAAEAFTALRDQAPAASAIGQAQSLAGQGQLMEAEAVLTKAESAAVSPAIEAELARLAFRRGDHQAAAEWGEKGVNADGEQLLARWIQAELARCAGRLDEAAKGYDWFINYYNSHDVADADSLRWIGLAAAQHARWKRLSDQHGFLVNELYPDALKLDPNFWPAHLESGLLFLEKFNQVEAQRSFQAALKINPRAAEVYAAIARLAVQSYDLDQATRAINRALELNPRLAEAHRLRSDVCMANFDAEGAIRVLEQDALPLDPQSEETLGRLAAAYVTRDGKADEAPNAPFGKIRGEVLARNEHAGVFFLTLAESLEQRRRFPQAEPFFLEAMQRMPQLPGPQSGLGMMYMRLGREEEARQLLETSFEGDPFNVRVNNTLKVLDLLSTYETIESPHFIVRFDPQKSSVLAKHVLAQLEEVYPKLVQLLGYEPPEKSLFEIMSGAKNTDAHGWFSARMVGLPYVGTVGACAGKMVALASPNEMKPIYNWARVVQHEFVHVINLQQTNFNIPHWFTEAIAVWNEGYPRPAEWNQLLAERVPKGETFDLNTINLGFIRPNSSNDWQMAYCQAELYAEFMLAQFGDDAISRLLAAYAENLNTRQAIQRMFGITQEEFDKQYGQYVRKIVDGLSKMSAAPELTFAELERAHDKNPDDLKLAADLAYAYLQRKSNEAAKKLAERVIAKEPNQPLATYVLARLHLMNNREQAARDLLEKCLDPQAPDAKVLNLLGAMELKAKAYDRAAELFRLGAKQDPYNPDWQRRLARVYLDSQDEAKLTEVLTRLAEIDADDFTVRKKLAQLASAQNNSTDTVRWAKAALHVNVMDVDVHRMLAEALVADRQFDAAAAAYTTAIQLRPREGALRMALVSNWLEAGRKDQARAALEELLEIDPEYPGARALSEDLAQ